MKKYPYKKADAFTGGASRGNPAAFLVLDDELSPTDYLAIAKAHAGFVSEMVFCRRAADFPYKLTYYSSECEVGFCGHGTIAAMYELIRNDDALLAQSEIQVATNRKGVIRILNRIAQEDAIYITAPAPQFFPVPAGRGEIAAALGIDTAKIAGNYPIDFIDAGLRTLIVPMADFQTEISIYPALDTLKAFCLEAGVDIILIFSKEASGGGFIAHTRVFAPKFGYLEDPATGSGNSAFGNYMLKYGLWSGVAVSVEQGGSDIVFNTVKLTAQNGAVSFGGRASVRIEGVYFYG